MFMVDRFTYSSWLWPIDILFPDRDLMLMRDKVGDLDSPKHGKMDPDNAPHVGGNTWAGGTGGRDTAGN